MVTLLAFIGIIVIFWYCSKKLKKAAAWLTAASFEWADYREAMRKNQVIQNQLIRQQNIKAVEKVQAIKGGQSDVVYTNNVRAEIDELERELNSYDE